MWSDPNQYNQSLQSMMEQQSEAYKRQAFGRTPDLGETIIKKEDLLKVLRDNREKHQKDYQEACGGYAAALKQYTDDVLAAAAKTKVPQRILVQAPPVPENYTKEYDTTIKMLELSVSETVKLSEAQFRTYVMDEWNWKGAFDLNTTYLKSFSGTQRSASV